MIAATAPIRDYMTETIIGIDADLTLADAKARMANEQILHLPALSDGRLVGILSARDIILMDTTRLGERQAPADHRARGRARACRGCSPRDGQALLPRTGLSVRLCGATW